QNLTLTPGRTYRLTARIHVSRGGAYLSIGRSGVAADAAVAVNGLGEWQTLSVLYTPVEAAATFIIYSNSAGSEFKVDDVRIEAAGGVRAMFTSIWSSACQIAPVSTPLSSASGMTTPWPATGLITSEWDGAPWSCLLMSVASKNGMRIEMAS